MSRETAGIVIVRRAAPVLSSQTLTAFAPLTTSARPSPLTPRFQPAWPFRSKSAPARHAPVAAADTSQILIVLSRLVVASNFPSALKLTAKTSPLWPLIVARLRPTDGSKSLIVLPLQWRKAGCHC